jgi:predicted XRE-type DNA-binding protein
MLAMSSAHDNADASEYEESSGNVFADLGIDDADNLDVKAQLAQVIREQIRGRGLSQKDTAQILGTDQSKVSQIMNGKVAGFACDRLIRFLNALECNVEIRVTRRGDTRHAARTVVASG